MTICESSGISHSSQEFEDGFYFQLKVLWCKMRLSGFLVFIKELRWFSWRLSHLSSRRNRWSFDRHPVDKNKLSGHVVSCCVTQYTMFFDCIESRRSVSTSNIFLSYRLIIKYWDEYFISLSRDVVTWSRDAESSSNYRFFAQRLSRPSSSRNRWSLSLWPLLFLFDYKLNYFYTIWTIWEIV